MQEKIEKRMTLLKEEVMSLVEEKELLNRRQHEIDIRLSQISGALNELHQLISSSEDTADMAK